MKPTFDHTDALRSPMMEWHPQIHVLLHNGQVLPMDLRPGAVIPIPGKDRY